MMFLLKIYVAIKFTFPSTFGSSFLSHAAARKGSDTLGGDNTFKCSFAFTFKRSFVFIVMIAVCRYVLLLTLVL